MSPLALLAVVVPLAAAIGLLLTLRNRPVSRPLMLAFGAFMLGMAAFYGFVAISG